MTQGALQLALTPYPSLVANRTQGKINYLASEWQTLASSQESLASSAQSLSYIMSNVYLGVDRTMQNSTASVTGQPKHAKILNSSFAIACFHDDDPQCAITTSTQAIRESIAQ